MVSDGTSSGSGYRQPVQARAFGTGTLILGGMVVVVLFGIQRIAPPIRSVDAGRAAVFMVESIPRDPVVEPGKPSPTHQPPSKLTPPSPPATTIAPAPVSPPHGEPAATLPASLPVPARQPQAMGGPIATANGDAPSPPSLAAPADRVSLPAAAADWRARLLGHLKRYRRYPRQAEATRQQGIVRIAITLRRSGEVTAVELIHGSGYPLLDQEARATARRASPVPPVDDAVPGDPVTVEVPIDFTLRR
ncbi:energy transducer TonB [Sphingomonas fuzhouensis]|uniref:energy transducer TonB n=1 Tax=Sphingomonas fuzhouensis TaxID=3106033 RepID=UPI002B0027D6|nr:energy transducer TonB [Sphingomonas sp. SGZ-02]